MSSSFRRRLLAWGGGASVLGLAATLIGVLTDRALLMQGYLLGYVFAIQFALGALGLSMIPPLVGGRWGEKLAPIFDAQVRALWIFAPLFAPLVLGGRLVFPWLDPARLDAEHVLSHRRLLMNLPFFSLRAALYFAVYLGLGLGLRRLKTRPEALKRLAAPGLVLFGLTASAGAIDWIMSLDNQWFSTVFALLTVIGQGMAALAFAVIVALALARDGFYGERELPPELKRDFGNLLLVFIMLWAYLGFAQYLIQWSGDMPREVGFYSHRSQGGWQWLALAFFVIQFALPFLFVLMRSVKEQGRGLILISSLMLAGLALTGFWTIKPMFSPDVLRVSPFDVLLPLGLTGLWLVTFTFQLGKGTR